MTPLLLWLQNLPLSLWVAESESIWGYAFMLFVHAIGMGLTAGIAFVVCLRLLGVAVTIPVSSLRTLFRLFWVGFFVNLGSGLVLFMADATGISRVPVLYVKLACLGLGLFAMARLRAFVESDRSDGDIPPSVRTTAMVCIVIWLGVITSGRLIAYAVESSGSLSLAPVAQTPAAPVG